MIRKGWRTCSVDGCNARLAMNSKHVKCEIHRRTKPKANVRGPMFMRSSPRYER